MNENPAMKFIGQKNYNNDQQEQVSESILLKINHNISENKVKLNMLHVETKSRRLNMLIQPSLHEKIKSIAQERGDSVNETIHKILQEYVYSNLKR